MIVRFTWALTARGNYTLASRSMVVGEKWSGVANRGTGVTSKTGMKSVSEGKQEMESRLVLLSQSQSVHGHGFECWLSGSVICD